MMTFPVIQGASPLHSPPPDVALHPAPGAEESSMQTTAATSIARKSAFAWVALASCALLSIPFAAMQFTPAVNWDVGDFVIMGAILFAGGSTFVLVARKVRPRHWWVVGALVAVAFVYVWAELAVGIFTSLGS